MGPECEGKQPKTIDEWPLEWCFGPGVVVDIRDLQEGPYGAKGVGEIGLNNTIPAIANAIYDAIGIRFHHTPIGSEELYTTLTRKESGSSGISRKAETGKVSSGKEYQT